MSLPDAAPPHVVVDDRHPFDLAAYAAQFQGRALITRLTHVALSTPSLHPACAALALPAVRQHTYDLNAFDFFGGSADDPWRAEADTKASSELDKLEAELKSVSANLIKESIRICNLDLGRLYLKTGDPAQALRCFVKTREVAASAAQVLEMSMLIIETNIELRSYAQLPPYIVKATSALDRPPASAPSSSVPLSAAQARAKADEERAREDEREKVGTRLQVAKGLSCLGQGSYEKAARELLAVKGELGEWGSTVISPSELATLAALTALATLRRSALRSEFLLNDALRPFVDDAPHVRSLVEAFVDGKYRLTLEMLERHSAQHALIPYLAPHLANLTASVRRLALIQYFEPFASASLARMSAAFGLPEATLRAEVVELVRSGEVRARLDAVAGVLEKTRVDGRDEVLVEALAKGEQAERATRRALVRMKLVEDNLILADPSRKAKPGAPPSTGGAGGPAGILTDDGFFIPDEEGVAFA